MTRHTFSTVVSLILGTEEEHRAEVSGEFVRGYRPSWSNFSGEPGEDDSFEIDSVVITYRDEKFSIPLKLLSDEQISELEREGVDDYLGAVTEAWIGARALARG